MNKLFLSLLTLFTISSTTQLLQAQKYQYQHNAYVEANIQQIEQAIKIFEQHQYLMNDKQQALLMEYKSKFNTLLRKLRQLQSTKRVIKQTEYDNIKKDADEVDRIGRQLAQSVM